MTPLDAAALVAALALAFYRILCWQLDRAEPEDFRHCGIVIVRERALDAHSQPIGEYSGHAIWQSVTFRGLTYDFNRVQALSRREQLAPGELFLDPGLVYAARVTA